MKSRLKNKMVRRKCLKCGKIFKTSKNYYLCDNCKKQNKTIELYERN